MAVGPFDDDEDEDAGDLSDAQRLVKLKADKLELEIAMKKRELVPADEIKKAWREVSSVVRSKLEIIPHAIADEIIECDKPAQAEQLLRAKINEALEELGRGECV